MYGGGEVPEIQGGFTRKDPSPTRLAGISGHFPFFPFSHTFGCMGEVPEIQGGPLGKTPPDWTCRDFRALSVFSLPPIHLECMEIRGQREIPGTPTLDDPSRHKFPKFPGSLLFPSISPNFARERPSQFRTNMTRILF